MGLKKVSSVVPDTWATEEVKSCSINALCKTNSADKAGLEKSRTCPKLQTCETSSQPQLRVLI